MLAPDIRSSLGISRGALGVIGGAFGILFFLGSVPIDALADRVPRKYVGRPAAMSVWAVIVAGHRLHHQRGCSSSLPACSPG